MARLETQVDLIGEYNDDLLATVCWSIGLAAGAGGILLGFNWLAGYRLLEREKKALRSELADELKRDLAAGQEKSRASLAALVQKRIGALEADVAEVRIGLLEADGRCALEDGIPANAVTYGVQMLDVAVTAKDELGIGRALQLLIDGFQGHIDAGSRDASPFELSTIQRALDKVPPGAHPLLANARRLLGEVAALRPDS